MIASTTSQIITADTFIVFWHVLVLAVIMGLFLGLAVRATWWIWR